jgi:hypothetical protein
VPSVTGQTDDGRVPRPPIHCGAGNGSHRMHVVGYVRRSEFTRMDCAQPLRVVCRDCGHQDHWRCDCSSSAKCPDCAERRRRLVARLVDLGTSKRLGGGFTYFLTLSAPGENEHKQWVQVGGGSGVKRLPANRPICGCESVWQGMERGDWNRHESANWNRLRTSLSRLVEGSLTYIGSVEVQDGSRRADGRGRGMLHRHVVLHVDRPLVAAEVGALALAAGYGCVHDLQVVLSAEKVAWYISKYVMKSAGDRGDVPWRAEVIDRETGEVRVMETTPTFRTWSAARSWGFTLRGLRDIARAQAAARARYLEELAELLATPAEGPAVAAESSAAPT